MSLNFAQADKDAKAKADEAERATETIVIADAPIATADNDVDPFATPEELRAESSRTVDTSGGSSSPEDRSSALTGRYAESGSNVNPLGAAAADYANRGWRVFPIWPIRDGKCACGVVCSSPGKHPLARLVPRGLLDASTDPADIFAWWTEYPDANVGVVTGNGLVVLDVDPKNGGGESLKALLNGTAPWGTPTVITGSGGLHFYFKSDKEFRNKTSFLGYAGIDVRGDGGYVVAPPSNHASGGTYQWDQNSLAFMAMDWPWPDAEKAIAKAEPVDNEIPSGQRNSALASIAGTMRRRGLEVEEIEAALLVVNEKRCNPPLSANEVSAIAKSVSRYEPEDRPTSPTSDPLGAQLAYDSTKFLELEVRPPSWLVEGIWPERAVGFVSGPPKSFKSFFALELAFAISTGRELLDKFTVPTARRVLILQAESDLSSFQDRVRRAREHYGDAPDLFVISNKPLYLDDEVDVDRLRFEIRAVKPELVIIDPISSFHKYNENDTQSMQALIRTIRGIRDEFGTGVLLVHHWTKTPPGERMLRGGERMRGNSSLHGANEASVFMRRVSDDVNRSNVNFELKESGTPDPFTVQFDPDTSALRIVTASGILFGVNPPSKTPYWQKDGD